MRFRRLDIEVRRADPDDWNAAKFDIGGIKDDANKKIGGLIEVRLPFRLVVQVVAWWEIARDVCQAINAAIWRREDRKRNERISHVRH